MLITAVIHATEKRDVSVVGAPGALMMAYHNEEVIVILANDMLDTMLEIDVKLYGKYVMNRMKGGKYMYVCLIKAMYGTMKAELLFYRNFSKEPIEYGFVINPYDPCVANKWTDKGQLTVVWCVNNIKVLYKNEKEVTKFNISMKGIYGNSIPVSI